MAFNISFSVQLKSCHDKFSQTFISPDGEEYKIDLKSSRYSHFNDYSTCTITTSWKRKSRRFLRLRSYFELNTSVLSDEKLFANDNQLSANSEVRIRSCSRSLIVINIIPYDSIPMQLVNTVTGEKQNLMKVEPVSKTCLESLSYDLKNLFQTGHLSDVTLTDGSKNIKAHKLILSARSSVFSKMFHHKMKENEENIVTIKDISIEVLTSLLNFMYTGSVVLDDMKMARDLYVAADKYDVKILKDICSGMLKSVNLDNVLDTLLLADLYRDIPLKQAALNFISNNYSPLKALEKWNKFKKENQDLAIEILSFVLEKK